MRVRACCGIVSLVVVLAAAACGSPAAPVVPTAAPQLLTPDNGAQVANQAQPVTLVVLNSVSSKPGTTYTFEVAADVAFTNKLQTKDGIAEGTNGQTSVTLDALPAAKDYYWRARAQAPGATGVFSDPFKFAIGAARDQRGPDGIDRPDHLHVRNRQGLGLRVDRRHRNQYGRRQRDRFHSDERSADARPPVLESDGDGRRERRHERAEPIPEFHAPAVLAGGGRGPAVGD